MALNYVKGRTSLSITGSTGDLTDVAVNLGNSQSIDPITFAQYKSALNDIRSYLASLSTISDEVSELCQTLTDEQREIATYLYPGSMEVSMNDFAMKFGIERLKISLGIA